MWKRAVFALLFVCLSAMPGHPLLEVDRQDPGHYLNMFLIQVDDELTAQRVARDNGFVFLEQLPQFRDLYLLNHPEVTGRSKRSAEDYVSRLRNDNRVKFVEQQITLRRVKRTHEVLHDKQLEFPINEIKDKSLFYRNTDKFDTRGSLGSRFNDEYFEDQWYLHNEEQTGGKESIDLNVVRAWDQGFNGEGTVVTTLDDGIDHEHPDIRNNYDPDASADMNDRSDVENDPTPDKSSSANSHGTRCAGEIAAEAGNGICGVGVAFKAKIGGIRILDGAITDTLEARALLYNNEYIDIFSASWGPHDDGQTMEGPSKAAAEALKRGVEEGRGGLGSLFVWATGNGGVYGDMCGADGYVSSPSSISVQSLTDHGDMPFFGEKCCSTLVSVPTGGEATAEEEADAKYKIKVVTTDIDGGCVENFEGTSSAAPLASGCYALLLQANRGLSWRDVQHITVMASRISFDDSMWTINGAGYHVNDKFGHGMMDCARMIELGQGWVNKPPQHICQTDTQTVNRKIESSSCYKTAYNFDACHSDSKRSITHLEHVELEVKLESGIRGNVEIFLESPAGTRSKLLTRRENDQTDTPIDFTFMTVHSWMEHARGDWTIEVCDNPGRTSSQNTIQFMSWSLRANGFHDDVAKDTNQGRSRAASSEDVQEIMKREALTARSTNLKRAQPAGKRDNDEDTENRTNKLDQFRLRGQKFGTRTLGTDKTGFNKMNRNFDLPNDINYNDGRRLDTTINGRDFIETDGKINELKNEVLKILGQMGNTNLEVRNYLQDYFQHKRELERKRRINELISEIENILGNE